VPLTPPPTATSKPLLACAGLAVVLTALAAWCAVHVNSTYYARGTHHDDSASYHVEAVHHYELYRERGLGPALLSALRTKDGLDVTLRLLAAPGLLLPFYGHLAVLLPFLALFFFLLLWFVRRRTGSLLPGVAVAAFVFTMPPLYHPTWGMADYWKDNLATWLLAGAGLAWLLSEGFRRRGWTLLCGLLLALLGMQRTALAVYACLLFTPLFAAAAWQRLRQAGSRTALLDLACAVLPGVAAAGLVASLQWDNLYSYYLVNCYQFGSKLAVAGYVWRCACLAGPWTWLALGAAWALCLLCFRHWRQFRGEILVGLWLAGGLPLAIILTSAHYPWLLTPWQPLLVVLLAVLVPCDFSQARPWLALRPFAAALLLAAAVCALGHYQSWLTLARAQGRRDAYLRHTYDEVAAALAAEPAPRHYGLFFYECNGPFWCQAFFNGGARLEHPLFFMAIHDSYFQSYGPRTVAEIAAELVGRMEAYPDALAVAYCDPADQARLPDDLKPHDASARAAAIFTAVNAHLQRSPHWKVVRRLELDTFRPVYLFRYSPRPLPAEEKWRDVPPAAVALKSPVQGSPGGPE
jgi:hypothetical protein